MHHDTELIESIMACCLGIVASTMLDGYLKYFPMAGDWKPLIGLTMLFLGMGPVVFLAIERRIHERVGRYLRFFHAICAATVLVYCAIFILGIFLFVFGMKFFSYIRLVRKPI